MREISAKTWKDRKRENERNERKGEKVRNGASRADTIFDKRKGIDDKRELKGERETGENLRQTRKSGWRERDEGKREK